MSIHDLSKWLSVKADRSLTHYDYLKQYGKVGWIVEFQCVFIGDG